jgi:hypothetical protein
MTRRIGGLRNRMALACLLGLSATATATVQNSSAVAAFLGPAPGLSSDEVKALCLKRFGTEIRYGGKLTGKNYIFTLKTTGAMSVSRGTGRPVCALQYTYRDERQNGETQTVYFDGSVIYAVNDLGRDGVTGLRIKCNDDGASCEFFARYKEHVNFETETEVLTRLK